MGVVSGLSFPLRFGSKGHLEVSQGARKLHDNVKHLLLTQVGERLSHPELGVLRVSTSFRNMSDARLLLLRQLCWQAIEDGEPRVQVDELTVRRNEQEGTLVFSVRFHEVLSEASDSATVSYLWG